MDKPNWVVKEVRPLGDYMLELVFITGEKKQYDMKPYLDREAFKKLRDKDFFSSVRVDSPTVAWGNNLDIAPETLYEKGITI